jgi:predicted nucleic acid-binding protein
MARFLFDTYALICLVQNRPSYRRFADSIIITTQFNLIELYYSVLGDVGEKAAKTVYMRFKNCVVPVSDDVIFRAMKFRLSKKQDRKCNLSYVDAIAYQCARSLGIPFVTGDKEFEGIAGVEFVKE